METKQMRKRMRKRMKPSGRDASRYRYRAVGNLIVGRGSTGRGDRKDGAPLISACTPGIVSHCALLANRSPLVNTLCRNNKKSDEIFLQQKRTLYSVTKLRNHNRDRRTCRGSCGCVSYVVPRGKPIDNFLKRQNPPPDFLPTPWTRRIVHYRTFKENCKVCPPH